MAAVGRFGVKTRALDKFGLMVATFFGSEALGKARALGSRRLEVRRIAGSSWLLVPAMPRIDSVVDFLANAASWVLAHVEAVGIAVAAAAAVLLAVRLFRICARSVFLSLKEITFWGFNEDDDDDDNAPSDADFCWISAGRDCQ